MIKKIFRFKAGGSKMKRVFSTIKLIINTMASAGEVEARVYRIASRKADVKKDNSK